MEKLRIGVVGCGGIFNGAHLPAYEKMDNVELVAFCDIKEDRCKKLAEKFGADYYTDYADLIARDDIDSIDICTPNYLHSKVAVMALDAGKHVFCEKPDAVSPAEAKKMSDAYKKSGKTLMVMRNNRFVASSGYLKKSIEAGEFGDIYAGRCGWRRRRGIPGKGGWFTTKEESGGGPLIDLGVHMIDLAIWLMGNPIPVAVSGSTFTKFAEDTSKADSVHAKFGDAVEDGTFDVEDLAMGFIKFDNGACLQIEFSWASNIEKSCMFVQLYGDKAGCRWDAENIQIFEEKFGEQLNVSPNIKSTVGGHEANLLHYVDVVLNGADPCFVPEQGLDMIKILSAIYESAETGKEVRL